MAGMQPPGAAQAVCATMMAQGGWSPAGTGSLASSTRYGAQQDSVRPRSKDTILLIFLGSEAFKLGYPLLVLIGTGAAVLYERGNSQGRYSRYGK
jgi:hypothetical protein